MDAHTTQDYGPGHVLMLNKFPSMQDHVSECTVPALHAWYIIITAIETR